MKTVVLLYPTSCIYEIVILNYFLHFAGKEVLFVSPDGTPITAMEGYSINVSGKLTDIAPDEIELAIVPGGNIKAIDNPIVWNCLKDIKSRAVFSPPSVPGLMYLIMPEFWTGLCLHILLISTLRLPIRSSPPGRMDISILQSKLQKDEFISG